MKNMVGRFESFGKFDFNRNRNMSVVCISHDEREVSDEHQNIEHCMMFIVVTHSLIHFFENVNIVLEFLFLWVKVGFKPVSQSRTILRQVSLHG